MPSQLLDRVKVEESLPSTITLVLALNKKKVHDLAAFSYDTL